MTKCQAVLRDVKVIVKLMVTCKCAEGDEFFGTPKERPSWRFSTRKPNSFVRCCEVKSCLINCYKFITQIFGFKFFLNSWRNAATFTGSFLMCCERGVIREKSSLWRIRSTCRSVYFLPVVCSISPENFFVSIEQNFLFAARALLAKSAFSFASVSVVRGVGRPLRKRFLILPVFLCFAISLLIAD